MLHGLKFCEWHRLPLLYKEEMYACVQSLDKAPIIIDCENNTVSAGEIYVHTYRRRIASSLLVEVSKQLIPVHVYVL